MCPVPIAIHHLCRLARHIINLCYIGIKVPCMQIFIITSILVWCRIITSGDNVTVSFFFFFRYFINDIERHLQESINDGINIEQLQLWLLLLADDAVLFSESREGLQNNINNLESYCKKEWNLKANE